MATKNGKKPNFEKKMAKGSAYTPEIKNFIKIGLPHIVSEINAFLHFTQKFKMATKRWRKNDFWLWG